MCVYNIIYYIVFSYLLNIDERKRKYNSLKSDINTQQEPSEEELEAYRLKKHRHDDPMAQFILNS